MTKRGASAAVQAEIAKDANQPFHLAELYLDTGTIRMTDAFRDVIWGGNTYLSAGRLLDFSGVEETADMKVTQATVQLSGVDQMLISVFLSNAYIDRRLVIRKAFFDGSMQMLVDPFPIFDGRCDQPVINDDPAGGKSTIALTASSAFVDFERTPGRHTNDSEQQLHFPGDLGFQFVDQLNTQIRWGRQ